MKRFEEFVITITMAVIMFVTSFVGSYTFLYDVIDLYSDQASLGAIIFMPIAGYWIVKSAILRLKRK